MALEQSAIAPEKSFDFPFVIPVRGDFSAQVDRVWFQWHVFPVHEEYGADGASPIAKPSLLVSVQRLAFLQAYP